MLQSADVLTELVLVWSPDDDEYQRQDVIFQQFPLPDDGQASNCTGEYPGTPTTHRVLRIQHVPAEYVSAVSGAFPGCVKAGPFDEPDPSMFKKSA